METAWGDLTVCDAHVHFFSHNFFKMLGAQRGGVSAAEVAGIAGWEAPPERPEDLADRWVQELDHHQVSRCVLIASLPGDDDSVAAAVHHRPDRFHGFFFVNPMLPDAATRVDRAFSAGLRGVCFMPAMHRYSMHDAVVDPILAQASAMPGAVVFVHCGVLSVGIRKKLELPSPFDLRFSNPIDLHALALRYPRLPFIIPHFGAGYFREALMVADLCSNVYLDTSSSNKWVRYQPEHLRLRQVFERALEVLGPGRLLFGTDSSNFPRGWNASVFYEQIDTLHGIGVAPEEAAMIFGGNLERLLARGR